MIKHKLLLVALLALTAGSGRAVLPVQVNGEPLPSLAPLLEQVTPAVVNVYAAARVRVSSPLMDDPFFRRFFNLPDVPRERVNRSLGSGVIVDAENGYIVTNHHVIKEADEIAVKLKDGRRFEAELIGSDPDTDIAVVRIDGHNLAELPLGADGDLRVGDFVVAVGNPFGLGQTVTSGIVSALGRTAFRGLEFQNFIQTDASINPGNSGGALVNLRGELVGINTAIFTPSGGNVGIGFAIPADMARRVLRQLVEFGEVRRGMFGLDTQDLTADLAAALELDRQNGAVVKRVLPGLPAATAGLRAGDIIVKVGEREVRNADHLRTIEGLSPLDNKQRVEYLRDSKRRHVRLAAAVPPSEDVPGAQLHPALSGLVLDPASGRFGGVVISAIDGGSRAAEAGLQRGDLIFAANRTRVRGMERLREILRRAEPGRELLLHIRRGQREYLVRLD